MDKRLKELVDEGWNLFDNFPPMAKVNNSFPILYFGDLASYKSSPKRIVTVGLNPSKWEFSMNRFPEIVEVTPRKRPSSEIEYENYATALNRYFDEDRLPYMRWFGSYECLLNGFKAAYRSERDSVAINTDILFPVATSTDVNEFLSKPEADKFEERGLSLWNELISYLGPQLILFTGSKKQRDKLKVLRWEPFPFRDSRSKPYPVEIGSKWIDGLECKVVSGPYFNTPFAMLKYREKENLGTQLDAHLFPNA